MKGVKQIGGLVAAIAWEARKATQFFCIWTSAYYLNIQQLWKSKLRNIELVTIPVGVQWYGLFGPSERSHGRVVPLWRDPGTNWKKVEAIWHQRPNQRLRHSRLASKWQWPPCPTPCGSWGSSPRVGSSRLNNWLIYLTQDRLTHAQKLGFL